MILYAAYGSNLHPLRLRERARSATLLGAGELAGRALRFHKRGRDGSGKCDIVAAAGEVVHVGVYALDPADAEALHAAEGEGYRPVPVEVPGFGAGFTYVAAEGHVDPALQCFTWYRDLVVLGCEHLCFPRAYRDRVAATAAVEDADRARHARHAGLVARARGAVGAR